MMYRDFYEISDDLEESKINLSGIEESRDELSEVIEDLENQLDSLNCNKKDKLRVEKERLKVAYDKEISDKYDEQIAKIEDAKFRAKIKKDKLLEEVSPNNFKSKLNFSLGEELDKCKSLKNISNSFYGEYLADIIDNIIVEGLEKSKDLGTTLRTMKKWDKFNPKIKGLDNIINLLNNIKSSNESEDKNYGDITLACIIFVAFILVVWFGYPIIIILISILIIKNVILSNKILQSCVARKSLEVNSSLIEQEINKRINQKVSTKKQKISSAYEEYIERADKKIYELDTECTLELERQSKNFVFNPNPVEQEFRVIESSIESKLGKSKESYERLDKEYKEGLAKINNLNLELKNCLANLKSIYLPKTISKSLELPNSILLDIKDSRPVFFNIEESSSMYIYENLNEAYNFIELLYYQLTLRANPKLTKFYIKDTVHLGEVLKSLEQDEGVVIKSNSTEVKELDEVLNSEMKKRLSLIIGYQDEDGNNSLKVYNKVLRDMDCPQEKIEFILNIDPDLSSNSEDESQLLINGGKVGMYYYSFVSKDKLKEVSGIDKVLDRYNKVYEITNGSVLKRAKSYILEEVEH